MRCECQQLSHCVPDLCAELTQYQLVEISGLDAEKYLQGQLTADVAKLAVGEHTLTAHCDPKGKMSALLRLYKQAENLFVAVIHRDLLPSALVQLKKYAVFSKVTFRELEQPIFGLAAGAIEGEICQNATVLPLSVGQKRYLVWNATGLQTNGEAQLWDLCDIQDGMPILYAPNQNELIPQAVNLQAIEQAISFTKGCYIGQETVARAKYRGMNKRAMFTLVGKLADEQTVTAEIGGSVEMQLGENWKQTGTILSAVSYAGRVWLQVVLNQDIAADTVFRYQGVALSVYELPYSLTE